MAKILIYGGSGIISMEIVNLAIENGHTVTMINRGKRKQFIHPNSKCVIADMRQDSVDSIREKLSERFDTIIDFIAYTPSELERNMRIAKGLCDQYIYVSSATVYNTKMGRYEEKDDIGQNVWIYARQKADCERLLASKAESYGFTYTVIRPYITYGKTRIPLQFGPLEYYTIIHRMICAKPIPVYGNRVSCTLTWSKDFAVAAVGLIQNPKAINEAYHITGNYETDWESVLYAEAEAFGVTCETVQITDAFLQNNRLMRGLNAHEVIGDKGRNMLFDNRKIKAAVPDFTGETSLNSVLAEIVAYFRANPTACRVNYAWDARMDHALRHSGLLTQRQKKQLRFYGTQNSTWKDRMVYVVNRYDFLYYLSRILRKL